MEGQSEQGETMQQQVSQREDFTYKPDLSDIPLGVSPLSLDYLNTLVETGLWDTLEQREQDLIREYFKTNKILEDLQPLAKVRSTTRVQQIVSGALTRVWDNLPQQEKEKFPFEEIRKLKKRNAVSNSPENRKRKSEKTKADSTSRWEEIYKDPQKWKEMSQAMKRGNAHRRKR